MIPNWRKQYVEPERDHMLGLLSSVDTSEYPDMTVQSFRDDTDINILVQRFGVTGTMPIPDRTPFYGDFSEARSYHESLNLLIEARESFMDLPAKIRKRFDNDPGALLEFLEDPGNRDEAIELGLVDPPPPPVAVPVIEATEEPSGAP